MLILTYSYCFRYQWGIALRSPGMGGIRRNECPHLMKHELHGIDPRLHGIPQRTPSLEAKDFQLLATASLAMVLMKPCDYGSENLQDPL